MKKKKVLKPIAQDFILMHIFMNICTIGIVVQYKQLWTLLVIIPLGIVSFFEAELINKYYKLPSMFLEGRYEK